MSALSQMNYIPFLLNFAQFKFKHQILPILYLKYQFRLIRCYPEGQTNYNANL